MLESVYQKGLIERIQERWPGCWVIPSDPRDRQGMLDLLILHGPHWAMLEVKRSATANHQPNQDYYVHEFNRLSFAAFIYPENEEDVLDALQQAFRTRGQTCLLEP